MEEIRFIDQTIRDGQQSWWGLRMRAKHMLPIASTMNRAGFDVIDYTGSAAFQLLVRDLKDNPWEALDAMRRALPGADMRSGARPNAAVSMSVGPLAVLDLFVKTLARHGITSIWIFDCLYNMDLMRRLADVLHNEGVKVVPTLMYSYSEFHTDDFFADKVREIASWPNVHSIQLEDASGVLTPERARTLVPRLLAEAGDIPLEMHCHNTTGLAPLVYIEAIKAGVRIIHTASRPLANGPSLPSTEAMIENIELLGYTHRLDKTALARMNEYFTRLNRDEGWPESGTPNEFLLSTYEHQIPGGMMGTLQNQLQQRGLPDKLPQVLEEVARVRRELGSPVMATPISQLVGIQSLLNILTGERYGAVPDEILHYCLGFLGEPPGPIDPNVLDRVLDRDRARELKNWTPPQPTYEDLRNTYGRHLSDEDLLLHILVSREEVNAMRARGPLDTTPPSGLDTVLRTLAQMVGSDARSIHLQHGDISIRLSR